MTSMLGESSLARNLPLVVGLKINHIHVSKVLISDGCEKNIMFLKTFHRLGLTFDKIKYAAKNIMILGMHMESIGSLNLRVSVDGVDGIKYVSFVLADPVFDPVYDMILGREWTPSKGQVPSKPNQEMQTIEGDLSLAKQCHKEECEYKLPKLAHHESKELRFVRRVVDCKAVNFDISKIPEAVIGVVKYLQSQGHKSYICGGAVRDIFLKKKPKDFDMTTHAPLDLVYDVYGSDMDAGVGKAKKQRRPKKMVQFVVGEAEDIIQMKQIYKNDHVDKKFEAVLDADDDARYRDCLARDFTINGIMVDVLDGKLYDYCGGLDDLANLRIRTINPPEETFTTQSIRLLRGVRIAARLGFNFTGHTGCWLLKLADVLDNAPLTDARMRQQNSMLLNGNARNSLILASQFGVVGKLPGISGDYFLANGIGKNNMFLELFNQLDKLVETLQCPCTIEFKNALIAFHSAILESPQHPKVMAAFCSALHEKKNLKKTIEWAEKSNRRGGKFSELKKVGSVDVERELKEFVLGPLKRNIEVPGRETDPIFDVILDKCLGLKPKTHGRPAKIGIRFSDDLASVITKTLFPYN